MDRSKLKKVGFWKAWDWDEMVSDEVRRGIKPGDPAYREDWEEYRYWPYVHLPDPLHLAKDDLTDFQRTNLVDYLKSGSQAAAYKGYSYCRFGCGISSRELGFKDLTDGEYLWPEGLWHYVKEHHIELPSEFVKKALNSMCAPFSGPL